MPNEPTAEEVNAIIEEAAQNELARIAGVPEPEKTPDEQSAQKDEPKNEQAAGEQNQEAKEPSLTEQFNEIKEQNRQLRKLLDTTNGKFGQEIQFIKRRLEQQPASAAPNLSDVFSRINIDDPAFAELKTEFPELAGQFVTAFNKALLGDAATKKQQEAGVDIPTTEKQTQQQEAQVTEQPASDPAIYEMAMDTLQTKHPDFLELAHFSADELAPGMVSVKWSNPNFGAWLDTMPSDVKEAVLIGGSVEHPTAAQILRISNIMTEYKEHEAKTGTATNGPADEVKETKQETRPRPKVDLTKTLMPSSRQSNKVAMTDEEIIEAAKQAELKRVMNGG